ncbi:LysR family transcriptional regulator [Azonexus sp. IMCC34842]|uniref:LysR family transcriptional regulator n=1 Tax=Azonexus sp. IMCC34842 TaxID=3420950 RepID=UPI003D115788
MNQIEAMQIYVRVAELASFTQAAQRLGLPKASISTAVQRLENLLGTRLLHRTTRRVQMTQDGLAFYERCTDLLADMEEVQGMFRANPAELAGRLRVDMPLIMARDLVTPQLPAFMAAHPQLAVELSSTDRLVDPVREAFDCVVRVGTVSDSSLIARGLGYYRMINCVSPAYVTRFGTPQSLDELTGHRLVHYVPTLGTKSPGFEYLDANNGNQTRFLPMPGALTVNNSEAYQAACLAGLGLIQAPEVSLRPLIDAGRLVEVLPAYRAHPMPVSLLYANRRHLPRRTRLFMAWLAELLHPRLVGPDGESPATWNALPDTA